MYFFKKQNQLEDKCINLHREIKKQEERVEMLEQQEYNKANGLTRNGGLATSVENIDRLKARIKQKEEDIANGHVHAYSKQYLRNDKKKLAELEALQAKAESNENSMSEKARELIEDGHVTQWAKKPVYYFVTGLRKVALELDDNGVFQVSRRYPATNEADKEFVENLLK